MDSKNFLAQMLFEEECEALEKALAESDNDRVRKEDHENSIRTVVLLGPHYDIPRAQEILKRVV